MKSAAKITERNNKSHKPHFLLLPIIILLLPGICLSQPNRERWQPPDKIMDIAGVKSGMTVGEVGAGRGYLTFPLARRVGPRGKIYANDISRYSLSRIESRMKNENINNIEIILGEIENPLFPEKNLDVVIMVYVFHHLDKPAAFFQNIKNYIKPDTPVVIVERDTEREPYQSYHFSSKEEIVDVLIQTGFELTRIDRSMERDAVYIFKLK